MQKVLDTYKQNTLTMLGYNPYPDINNFKSQDGSTDYASYDRAVAQYHWQEAVNAAQIQDFARIVREDGIEKAFNTYAVGLFNGIAQNTITQTAGIALREVGTYFNNLIKQFRADPSSTDLVTELLNEDGTTSLEVAVLDGTTHEKILSARFREIMDEVVDDYLYTFEGYDLKDRLRVYGNWGVSFDGKVGLREGHYNQRFQNLDIYAEISRNAQDVLSPKSVTIVDMETGRYTKVNAADPMDFESYGISLKDAPIDSFYPKAYEPSSSLFDFYEKNYTVEVGLGDPSNDSPEFTYYFLGGRPIAIVEQTDITHMNADGSVRLDDNGATVIKMLDDNGRMRAITFKLGKGIEIPIDSIIVDKPFNENVSYVLNKDGNFKTIYRNGQLYVVANEVFGEFSLYVPSSVKLLDHAAMLDELYPKIDEQYVGSVSMADAKKAIYEPALYRLNHEGISNNQISANQNLSQSELGVSIIDSVEHSSTTRSFLTFGNVENATHILESLHDSADFIYTRPEPKLNKTLLSNPYQALKRVVGQYVTLKEGGNQEEGAKFIGYQYSKKFTIGEGLDEKRFIYTTALLDISDTSGGDGKVKTVFVSRLDCLDNSWGVENKTVNTFTKIDDSEKTARQGAINRIKIRYNDGVLLDFDIEIPLGLSRDLVQVDNPVINMEINDAYNEFRKLLMGAE
jgi:hypothetical protein